MNTKLENRLTMYRTVIDACDEAEAQLQGVPALWNNYQLFKATVDEFDVVVSMQIRNLEGLTTNKTESRERLISKVMVLSGMLKSFADESEDADLFATVDYTPSSMRKMRDRVLYDAALLVRTTTEAHFADLAPYGIKAADLNEFSGAMDDFASKMDEPEKARKLRKAYTSKLKDLDQRARKLLGRRIDTAIRTIFVTDPMFLSKYMNARSIYDYGSGRKKNEGVDYIPAILSGRVCEPDGTVIVDALVSVEGTSVSVFTDDEGEYLIDTIAPGKYNVVVSAEGFADTRENDLVFASGDDIGRDFVLEIKEADLA